MKESVSDNSITLKEHLSMQIDSVEKSIVLARDQMDKRLEGMNEFRDQLKDQASKFVTREEISIQIDNINKDLRILRESRATLEGKASQGAMNITIGLAMAGLVISLLSIFVRFL